VPVAGLITPFEFATDEWDKLARAWRLLNPSDRDLQIRRQLDQMRDDGRLKLYPELPGWDDILRLGAVPPGMTEADIKARRKRIAARIRQSTTPPAQQAIANVINAIDDVQDLASFAGLAARMVLRAAPRVAARFVPILGWVATASDVLNLLSFLALTGGIALGIRSEGPLAGATAIAGPAFVKAALKREMWTMLRRSAFKNVRSNALTDTLAELFAQRRAAQAANVARYGAVIGKPLRFTELLEAGQALETLTGYGISLGAIMGFLSDASWALYRDVIRSPISRLTPLTQAIAKAAPPEWVILDPKDELKPVHLDQQEGPGPAWDLWMGSPPRYAFSSQLLGELVPEAGTLGVFCYFAKWIQHPNYPREPDSLVYFTTSNMHPSQTVPSFLRQQLSTVDIILTAHAAKDGL
jgi:hypothetical protein